MTTFEQVRSENLDIVQRIEEMFMESSFDEIRIKIAIYFIPSQDEKKKLAEIPTPVKLVDVMLAKFPKSFWTKPRRVLEPCCGKGNFVLAIYDLFDKGLEKEYPDERSRARVIIEECIHYWDIGPLNVFITTELLRCRSKNVSNKFNMYVGDALKKDVEDNFDAVIGNPPYNSFGDTGTGNTIWQHFTKESLNKFLNPDGYLLSVHPPGWRKPNTTMGKFHGLYELMTHKNQMIYLSIHGIKDGKQTFDCGTRYDWYLIQHKPQYTTTIVNDEKGNTIDIDMNDFEWLPNYNIDTIQRILAKENEDKCHIIYDRTSYGADKKDRLSKTKTDEFRYPCIHSTPKSGIRYMYSKCNDRGHFGVSKVIFGESGIYDPVIDMEGKYGMTHGAMAIKVEGVEDGNDLKKVLTCVKFNEMLESCLFSSFRIEWNMFKTFKKDFWKEFVV